MSRARISKRLKGFGGFRHGLWVETVAAEYTRAEVALLQQLVADNRVNEAAWVHGLKAAFQANIVAGLDIALEAQSAYEQGVLL